MDAVTVLHAGFARALVLYLAVLGIWGLIAWRQGRGITPSYRGALVIAWLTGLAQGGFGLLLWAAIGPHEALHILYGFALAVALPAGYVFTRDRPAAQASLVMGVVALFAAGLAIRGITTS